MLELLFIISLNGIFRTFCQPRQTMIDGLIGTKPRTLRAVVPDPRLGMSGLKNVFAGNLRYSSPILFEDFF